jgi:hypothetical protein
MLVLLDAAATVPTALSAIPAEAGAALLLAGCCREGGCCALVLLLLLAVVIDAPAVLDAAVPDP